LAQATLAQEAQYLGCEASMSSPASSTCPGATAGALDGAVSVELRPGRRVHLLHHFAPGGSPAARVLLCHGSMASMSQYRAIIERLMCRKDLDILAYDWLGCGASSKPRDWEAYSTPNLLSDLEAAYRLLLGQDSPSCTAPAVLVGHSFGTSLVMQLAADLAAASPAKAAGALPPPTALCLMSPSDGASAAGKTGLFYLPETCLRLLQPVLTASFTRMAFHPETSDDVKAEGNTISAANEMHVCKAFYRQMSWCQPQVTAMAGPALILHGEEDGVVEVDEGRRVADGFEGQVAFRTLARASHQLMMEQPAETGALLEALIDNVAAGRDALSGL